MCFLRTYVPILLLCISLSYYLLSNTLYREPHFLILTLLTHPWRRGDDKLFSFQDAILLAPYCLCYTSLLSSLRQTAFPQTVRFVIGHSLTALLHALQKWQVIACSLSLSNQFHSWLPLSGFPSLAHKSLRRWHLWYLRKTFLPPASLLCCIFNIATIPYFVKPWCHFTCDQSSQ